MYALLLEPPSTNKYRLALFRFQLSNSGATHNNDNNDKNVQ